MIGFIWSCFGGTKIGSLGCSSSVHLAITCGMAGFLLFSCRAPGMGNLANSGGGGELIFRGEPKIRTTMRLSSRFCVFCGAKQAKTSPVRRLSTLNYRNAGFRAAKLGWLVSMAQKGATELIFRGRREQKKRHSLHDWRGLATGTGPRVWEMRRLLPARRRPSTARSDEWPGPGFPFGRFSGCWRALAKGTA